MKIVVISPGLSLPRYIKRVKSFVTAGHDVVVYGYTRGEFQNLEGYPQEVNVVNLGSLEDAKGYLYNVKKSFKDQVPIIKKHNDEDVLFYSFGFIQSLMLYLFAKRPYMYEISDLVYGTFRNLILRNILACIDRRIIKKAYCTIMTSSGFKDYLFPLEDRKNILIQPNKLDASFNSLERKKKSISKDITFGFVGYIRYPNTVFRFARIIGEKYPNHKFYFYGDSIYRTQAIAISNTYDNVKYFGKYKNPDDLQNIYNSIDVVVSCYDTTTFNERIAEPNKLYESIYYCKPIIVSPGTFLEKRVLELDCGLVLDATNDDSVINFIDNLSIDKLNLIVDQEYKLPLAECVDNPLNITDLIK